ncbi:uncharacterized protein LOC108674463 [Hyalella azteca]|uniref:Uncharacterized protein LOC108674463 n=1 Tax=Hyalella azteca TaxID=294128 RepID=A0A8B7NVZ3_HYAAZ|nr:uncharacterized protein LOC108674463 [Hyalella azteca]
MERAVQERKRINASMNCKAPKDGQQLYLSIAKCFNDTQWNDNADIVVEEGVIINPPYTAACVHTIDPSNPQSPRFAELIQKMVNRYHQVKERQPEPSTADLSKAPPPIIESASEASAQR